MKTRSCFNIKEIDANVAPMVKDMTKLRPDSIKAKLVIVASVVMMFYVSWRLALVALGVGFVHTILKVWCMRRDDARMEKISFKR